MNEKEPNPCNLTGVLPAHEVLPPGRTLARKGELKLGNKMILEGL
jgi:hypothetical protein